ncbi:MULTISPECIES: hypothetical protein [Lactobacillus]|uniref:hypothetical protein n=1 Tax=Lactobacillus TaxID=1578 RepID=UPI00137471F4|nr:MULTISPECIES: hypothetical protein [Lactobacillus]
MEKDTTFHRLIAFVINAVGVFALIVNKISNCKNIVEKTKIPHLETPVVIRS